MMEQSKGNYMTRTEKWAERRAEIEKEAEEIKIIVKTDEYIKIFDEMMGKPIEQLEELVNAFN